MNINRIKELVKFVDESGISELSVKTFGSEIRIIKNHAPVIGGTYSQENRPATLIADQPSGNANSSSAPIVSEKRHEVKAPIVGTFYRKPSPDSDPYVSNGTRITKGQGCLSY
jgi:biotin carboxyl carrier protein